jgi:hypothetical protein
MSGCCVPLSRLIDRPGRILEDVSTTIRVSDRTKARIAALATEAGRPMTEVIDEAVEAFDRAQFLDRLNRAFGNLRRDDHLWAEVEAERAIEEGSAADESP